MFEGTQTEAPRAPSELNGNPATGGAADVAPPVDGVRVEPLNKRNRSEKAQKEAVRRRLEKLKRLDASKLDELIALSEGKAEKKTEEAPIVGVTAEPIAKEPGQIPGWPAPSEIAAWLPHCEGALQFAQVGLPKKYGERLLPMTQEFELNGKKITVTFDPTEKIAKPLAAVLAKYAAKINEGGAPPPPEVALLGGMVFAFGPVAVVDLWEFLQKRKAEREPK